MRKKSLFLSLLLLLLPLKWVSAQSAEADSVDVLQYNLTLDLGGHTAKLLRASADITFVLTRDCDRVTFDLVCDTLQPVSLDGTVTRGFSYDRDLRQVSVNLNGGHAGDTHTVSIPYVSRGYIESYGWGGLHFDNTIYYTLGVAFQEYPHVFGRSWFPCRDNFYDKATYRFAVTSQPGWRAICSGLRQSETQNADGTNTSVWLLDRSTPTYLVSVSSAPWHVIERDYEGAYGTYPAIIGYTAQDSAAVYHAYNILEDVIPAYERSFGPYRWDRIGYIATPRGSMEHVSNIGLAADCMASRSNDCQMVICHELGHAWFGNLITCASAGDMWINEGGATFCEEVATEAAFGHEAAVRYYQDKVCRVLRAAYMDDYGYRSLSDMDEHYTYGTTTYQKGAIVFHSLRGIMGDSLFYSCMQRLFDRCAFSNLDAASFRDSLSLYSGIDLTGFFDFHVFGKGFVDYHLDDFSVEGNTATVTLRQLLRGTDQYARGNRVPLTFFSADREMFDGWMMFDDSVATQTFDFCSPLRYRPGGTWSHLPGGTWSHLFVPQYVVVDYHNAISDASTSDTATLHKKGLIDMDQAYCKVSVGEANSAPRAWVHVAHHFAHPTGDTLDGIVRMADRYWQVSGNVPWEGDVQGRFFYNQGSIGSSGAAYLDLGFYEKRQTLDSMALMYRPTAQEPWQLVSRKRTSGSSVTNGYFTARLFPGQYALAVIDSNLLSVSAPQEKPILRLSPNPTASEFRIQMGGYEKNFDVSIIDSMGRKVMILNAVSDGDIIRTDLPAGTYIVLIQNNFLSLQSQIIIQ